jgi:ABC-type uncharacterized transport system permease subunit
MPDVKSFIKDNFQKVKTFVTDPTMEQKNRRFNVIKTLAAALLAIIITCIVLALASGKPLEAIKALLFSPLKGGFWIGEIFRVCVPLIFTGIAASLMLRSGQFNMLGEGCFYMGGFVAALVAIYLPVSGFLAVLLASLAGILVSLLFGLVPALLKAKLDVNEFVVSLMLNFIMLWLGMYFLQTFFRDEASGDIATRIIPEGNRFPILFQGTYLSAGIIVALVLAVLAGFFVYKTKSGYLIRVTGDNKEFAKYSGLNVPLAIVFSQLLGAAIAGLGGAVEILGSVEGRFNWKALPGYGFDGFIVAILAGNNPFLVPFAALFLAYLRTGAVLMSLETDIASEFVQIIQALIIIIVAGQNFLKKFKNRLIFRKESGEVKA